MYEIGVKKVHKEIKEARNAGDEGQKLSHRRYRKRSEEFHEEKYNLENRPGSITKKSSSEHRQCGSKKSMTIQNFYKNSQSLHCSQKNPKLTLFSNRNKSAKALHSSSNFNSSTGRVQVMGSFGLRRDPKKGLFDKSKSREKKLANTYSSSHLKFGKTA